MANIHAVAALPKTGLGHGLLHIRLTEALKALYEGPLHPNSLVNIELSLRAFILCDRLSILRITNTFYDDHDRKPEHLWESRITSPFDGDKLDYEFTYPELPPARVSLKEEDEVLFLNQIRDNLLQEISKLCQDAKNHREIDYLVESWYGYYDQIGVDVLSTSPLAEADYYDCSVEEYRQEIVPLLVGKSIIDDAKYLVECYRTRYAVFGSGPVFNACERNIFSNIPTKLLEDFDDKYRSLARLLRQPGLAVDLPVLTVLVLSRAQHRNKIPETIVTLREQYSKARSELWDHIQAIWDATTFRTQLKLYNDLKVVSENMFEAAFPARKKVMAVGFQALLSPIVPSAGVASLKEVAQQFEAQWRVGAISFAKQLTDDLHRDLGNQAILLRRHLSLSELRQFGLA